MTVAMSFLTLLPLALQCSISARLCLDKKFKMHYTVDATSAL